MSGKVSLNLTKSKPINQNETEEQETCNFNLRDTMQEGYPNRSGDENDAVSY